MKELKDKVVFYIPSESNGQSINNSSVDGLARTVAWIGSTPIRAIAILNC